MGKLKDQLAGIAALIAAIVAIGGGFVKYGEIVTKLDAIDAKEETTVLDQEDEISEPPEEKTEINDATGDIGAKLENLTKLYEEGILTKEELQKKTDELINKI